MTDAHDAARDARARAERHVRQHGRRLLVGQIRERWKGVAVGMFLGLLWTSGKLIIPKVMSKAIDKGIVGDGTGRHADTGWLWTGTIVILVLGAMSATCAGARRWNAFREARTSEAELRQRIFVHLQGLHFGYHDTAQTGDLMSRANTDLQSIQQVFSSLPMGFANLTSLLGATVILFATSWRLAALSMISLPFVNVVGRRFSQRLHPEVLSLQQESAQLANVVEEAVSGVRVVKGFGAEGVLAKRLAVEAEDVFGASMRASRVRSVYVPALELLPNVGLVSVLFFGGHQVLNGELTIGDLTAFNVYLMLMIGPLRMLGNLIAQVQRAIAAGGRIHEVLSTEPLIVDRHDAVPLRAGEGELRFEGVRFGYHQGRPVLDGIDLTIEAGTSVALVGATGSGKTTLARMIPRFYEMEAGRILLDGVDITHAKLDDLRRAVATVFEETFLFSDTIGANIAFADPDATDARIERAARLAGADEFIEALPDGYRTLIGERGFSLSGGQRQRIAIARAVLAEPRVLILDDATSAVDPTKEHEIRDSMAEVMRNRTTLVIAHRPATIALADRVVLLDEGRIVADGTHESLLATSERYREILAAAARHDDELVAAALHDGEPAASLEVEVG